MNSSFKEIHNMWEAHIKFNGWKVKNDSEENNTNNGVAYKRVNIDDISFL